MQSLPEIRLLAPCPSGQAEQGACGAAKAQKRKEKEE